jgi:hypothetical protein
MTASGMKSLVLSGAGPSAIMPKIRTTIAVVMTIATRLTPVKSRRVESKQNNVKIANPRGKAPEPTRVVVEASAEPRLTPVSAEA